MLIGITIISWLCPTSLTTIIRINENHHSQKSHYGVFCMQDFRLRRLRNRKQKVWPSLTPGRCEIFQSNLLQLTDNCEAFQSILTFIINENNKENMESNNNSKQLRQRSNDVFSILSYPYKRLQSWWQRRPVGIKECHTVCR